MSAGDFSYPGFFTTRVEAQVQRRYSEGAPHLITMFVSIPAGTDSAGACRFPQAHAVTNDFGDLVIVRGWQ